MINSYFFLFLNGFPYDLCFGKILRIIISDFMDVEYIKENYRFVTLTDNHDLSEFKSSSDDLTDFLKNDALTQQKSKLNLTKLVMCDDTIVAYVSTYRCHTIKGYS